MRTLAGEYPRFGHRRLRLYLERRGHVMSVTRAHRLWRAAGLQVPRRHPASKSRRVDGARRVALSCAPTTDPSSCRERFCAGWHTADIDTALNDPGTPWQNGAAFIGQCRDECWRSQDSVDTLFPGLVSGLGLLRTDATEVAMPA